MATITKLACPSCGGPVVLRRGSSECVCEYCGKRVVFGVPQNDGSVKPVCPSCGGELKFDPQTGSVLCLNCDSTFIIDDGSGDMSKGAVPSQSDFIFPFSRTKDDVRRSFVEWVGRIELIPGDIYEQVKIASERAVYVPMFLYNVDYNVSYSCDALIERTTDGKTKKSYEKRSGTVSGSHEVVQFASSDFRAAMQDTYAQTSKNELTSEYDEMRKLLCTEDAVKTRKKFDPHYLLGMETLEFDGSPRDVWPKIEFASDRKINSHIEQVLRTTFRSVDYNPKRVNWRSTSYYMPMNVIKYKYGGSDFTYVSVGDDAAYEWGSRPYDKRCDSSCYMGSVGACSLAVVALIILKIANALLDFLPANVNRITWYALFALIAIGIIASKAADIRSSRAKKRGSRQREAGRARALADISAIFSR